MLSETDVEVSMVDGVSSVEEGVGEVAVTIQRVGYLASDLEVYCYIANGNI